jgi:tetratricopeptide (TPR) repeat protein
MLATPPDGTPADTIERTVCQCCLVNALNDLGEFAEGHAVAAEALTAATALGHQYVTAVARYSVGAILMFQGRLDEATPHMEAVLALGRAHEFGYLLPFLHSGLGITHVLAGRMEEGLPLLETAVAQAEGAGITLWLALHLIRLGEGYLRSGRVAEARAVAQRAVDHTTRRSEERLYGWTLRLLGDIAVVDRDPDGVRHYHEAIELAREAGTRPLEAYCQLGLGRLFMALGKDEDACDSLTAAERLFAAMDMAAHRAEAAAALALL